MSDLKIFQVQGLLSKITTMSGGVLRMQFDTFENISAEAKKRMFEYHDQPAYMTINVREIEAGNILDLPPIRPIEKGDKTPSQRLRAVFYRIWEQNKGEYKTADDHYKYMMEELIDHYKKRLE